MRFGISTHLFHATPLERDHLVEVASYGFDSIELFATRTHFDYHDEAAVAELARWLEDTGLAMHAVHAPITLSLADGVWGPALSNASKDPDARRAAVRETQAALAIAWRIRFPFLTLHLGVPTNISKAGDNDVDAARRSIEELHEMAAPLGVRLAVEVIPNELSSASNLVTLIEDDLDLLDIGVCLDYGHAFLMGDLVDAIETVSGHLVTTHVHDNEGKTDAHLVPFDGGIDWAAAMIATQKVGYDGTLLLELANLENPRSVLEKARRARTRFERMLAIPEEP
jgi:sugar phosphate isomerase/epimerase